MSHDPELTERIGKLPQESFDGRVSRATGMNADPLAYSLSGGRWAPWSREAGSFPVLYTSMERDGALAEVVAHLGALTPIPRKPLIVHELAVSTGKTLRLVRAALSQLGVDLSLYGERNYERTQKIGAVVNFLGLDGLIAPSARWDCDNLIIFGDNHGGDERLETLASEQVDWPDWHRFIGEVS